MAREHHLFMTLSKSAQTVLSKVPEMDRIGGQRLQGLSGVSGDAFWSAVQELVDANLIAIGRGRGGSIRRVDADRQRFLSILPPDGTLISNNQAMRELGWDSERYWNVHAELIAEGLLMRGRGRGGSVGLVISEDAVDEVSDEASPVPPSSAPPLPAQDAREREWYPTLLFQLQHAWLKQFSEGLVEQTAWQGARLTGGTWTRPDLTAVTIARYRLVPAQEFDVWSFEVKKPDDWSIVGVHEASAHGRRSTRPCLVLVAPEETSDWHDEVLLECENEAARIGVGVVVAYHPYTYDCWDWRVEPERHAPAHDKLDEALGTQLTAESQERITSWFDQH